MLRPYSSKNDIVTTGLKFLACILNDPITYKRWIARNILIRLHPSQGFTVRTQSQEYQKTIQNRWSACTGQSSSIDMSEHTHSHTPLRMVSSDGKYFMTVGFPSGRLENLRTSLGRKTNPARKTVTADQYWTLHYLE